MFRFSQRLNGVLALVGLMAAACAPDGAIASSIDPQGATDSAQGVENVSSVPDAGAVAAVQLDDYGLAPELTNTVWLNTPDNQPLRLADLRGKVVALEFWNYWTHGITPRCPPRPARK